MPLHWHVKNMTLPSKQLGTTSTKNCLVMLFSCSIYVSHKFQCPVHVSYGRWVGTTSLTPTQRKNPRWVQQCRYQSTGMARYAGLPRGEVQGWTQASSLIWYLSPSMSAISSSLSWIQRLLLPKLKRLSVERKRTGEEALVVQMLVCSNFNLGSCLEEKTICCRNVQEFGSIFMLLVNTEDLDPGK